MSQICCKDCTFKFRLNDAKLIVVKHTLKLLVFLSIIFATFASAFAAPLVLGRRYPLNTKAERGTLVWQFVTFNRTISGAISVQLEVYNARAKSLKFFDDYRDIVDESIQRNTISKFSMDSTQVNFSSDRYARVVFQVSKLESLYYLPVRVDYHDGFEDYLVRLYFAKDKLALASRLLQQGRYLDVNSVDEEQEELSSKKKKKDKKKKKSKKDKQSASDVTDDVDANTKEDATDKNQVGADIDGALSGEDVTEPTIKMVPVDSDLQGADSQTSEPVTENPEEEQQQSDILDDLPSLEIDLSDPTFQDPSDIEFNSEPEPLSAPESSEDESALDSGSDLGSGSDFDSASESDSSSQGNPEDAAGNENALGESY